MNALNAGEREAYKLAVEQVRRFQTRRPRDSMEWMQFDHARDYMLRFRDREFSASRSNCPGLSSKQFSGDS